MLETIALLIGLAIIIAIVFGAGLLSMVILGGVFVFILFLTKYILFAIAFLLILITPFFAIGFLAQYCRGRTVVGTRFPLGYAVLVGCALFIFALFVSLGRSMSGMDSFYNDAKTMMEQCSAAGDHAIEMDVGDRHYHFSCQSHKAEPKGQDM